MSVTFYWRPVVPEKSDHFEHGTSDDLRAIENVFGALPREFDGSDLRILRAMTEAVGRRESVFNDIANKIEDIGTAIEVSVKW